MFFILFSRGVTPVCTLAKIAHTVSLKIYVFYTMENIPQYVKIKINIKEERGIRQQPYQKLLTLCPKISNGIHGCASFDL